MKILQNKDEEADLNLDSEPNNEGRCSSLFVQQVVLWHYTQTQFIHRYRRKRRGREMKMYLNYISHRQEVGSREDVLFVLLFITLPVDDVDRR